MGVCGVRNIFFTAETPRARRRTQRKQRLSVSLRFRAASSSSGAGTLFGNAGGLFQRFRRRICDGQSRIDSGGFAGSGGHGGERQPNLRSYLLVALWGERIVPAVDDAFVPVQLRDSGQRG